MLEVFSSAAGSEPEAVYRLASRSPHRRFFKNERFNIRVLPVCPQYPLRLSMSALACLAYFSLALRSDVFSWLPYIRRKVQIRAARSICLR